MISDSQSLVAELEKAAKGLLFPSESDYPFTVLLWPGEGRKAPTALKLLSLLQREDVSESEEQDFDYFFRNVTRYQDWHAPEKRQEIDRFKHLANLIKTNLTDVKVFRLGQVEIDCYIVGRTKSGDLVALKTTVIET